MAGVPLSDAETVLVFAGEALSNYRDLDAGAQERIINRLQTVLRSEMPPSHFRYERIANLDIIRAGDQPRLYTKIVEDVPADDGTYHVVVLF